LSEVVKETSGKSPKDWIIDYSLLEIKELLKNSSLNIQEITIRTKFLNQSALGRFFKRHTNMSPSEYRESTY
jgi:AraC-like DNA-binding protein